MNNVMNFTFIDLFCGIGGFHQALSSFGGKCVLACDIEPKAASVYNLNYHSDVFINGVLSTVKYSLRYISDLNLFISHYADLVEKDSVIKYEHKVRWNDIVLR